MKVAALVLAGDDSAAFSGSKYLSPLRELSLIETVLAEVHSWPVDDVFVVLGPDADPILASVDFGNAIVVVDLEQGGGDAAALRVGIDTLYRFDEYDTAVLIHADQPGSRPEEVEKLLERHRSGHKPAVIPKYRYSRGHPVVVGQMIWPRLISMDGTTGFDQILTAHPDWVDEVWFDRLPPRRISVPDDIDDHLELR